MPSLIAGRQDQTLLDEVLALVVDDDRRMRQTMRTLLQSFGYTVVLCEAGADAFTVLKHNAHASLIITDMVMPHMTGIEFAQLVRNNSELASIPIVFMTGLASESMLAQAQAFKNSKLLHKPISTELIREAIEELEPHVESGSLSRTETFIALMLHQGLAPKTIAERRGKSISTIRNQISSISAKYGLRSLGELREFLGSNPHEVERLQLFVRGGRGEE